LVGPRSKADRKSVTLLLAGILGDTIVERLDFRVENLKRASTRDAILARRRIFANLYRLDELFDVDATSVAASRNIEPALLLITYPAIERGNACRRIGALRLSERCCRVR
jgi:hypothetical protein